MAIEEMGVTESGGFYTSKRYEDGESEVIEGSLFLEGVDFHIATLNDTEDLWLLLTLLVSDGSGDDEPTMSTPVAMPLSHAKEIMTSLKMVIEEAEAL